MERFLCVLGIFDEETQRVLGEYQRAVLSQGFVGRQTMGIPFHVTLGTFGTERQEELRERLLDFKAGPVAVHFSHIGMFQGQQVLFLAPDVTRELLELKSAFNKEADWAAHTTVLMDDREKILQAARILGDRFCQFSGKIEKVSLYEFFPAVKLEEKDLKAELR